MDEKFENLNFFERFACLQNKLEKLNKYISDKEKQRDFLMQKLDNYYNIIEVYSLPSGEFPSLTKTLNNLTVEEKLGKRKVPKPIWNPVSEAFEFYYKGKIISIDEEEYEALWNSNFTFYKCKVSIIFPNKENSIVDAYIWRTTKEKHSYLIEKGTEVRLLVQLINEDEVFYKICPSSRFDLRDFAEDIPFDYSAPEHQDVWWNKIPF